MKGFGKGEGKRLIFLLLLCALAGCNKVDTANERTEERTVEVTEEITEELSSSETLNRYHDTDVEALQKIIEEQNALGADIPTDLNCVNYTWDENGRLTELSISSCNLKGELSCAGLPSLTYLDCSYNEISNLDVSQNPALENLDCSGNQISSLDVSNCPLLEDCRYDDNNPNIEVIGWQ